MRPSWLIFLVVAACFVAGWHCQELNLPKETIESEHFRYYYRKGDEPSDCLLERFERHYGVLSGFLGVELPPGQKIHYYKFRDRADFDKNSPCPGDVGACSRSFEVYTDVPTHGHEVVHTYTRPLGHPPALFVEGIAEVLTCGPLMQIDKPLLPDIPLEDLVESSTFRSQWVVDHYITTYDVARSFTRYLLDEFGVNRWSTFYATAPHNATSQQTSTHFENAFGVSFEQAAAGWRSILPQRPFQSYMCLDICADQSFLLEPGGSADFEAEIAECVPRTSLAIPPMEITVPTDIILNIEGTATVSLIPCVGSDRVEAFIWSSETAPSTFWVHLEPSTYFFAMGRPWSPDHETVEETAWYRLDMDAKTDVISETCETAEVQTIPPELEEVRIFAGNGRAIDDYPNEQMQGAGDQVVRFQVTEPRTLFYPFPAHSYDRVSLTLCINGCPGNPGSECNPLLLESGLPVSATETYALVMDSLPGTYGFYRAAVLFVE